MLLRIAVLLLVTLSVVSFSAGAFGVKATYDGSLGLDAFVEQSLLAFDNFEFVAGLRLDEALNWAPYSGVNFYIENAFVQVAWGYAWITTQLTYTW